MTEVNESVYSLPHEIFSEIWDELFRDIDQDTLERTSKIDVTSLYLVQAFYTASLIAMFYYLLHQIIKMIEYYTHDFPTIYGKKTEKNLNILNSLPTLRTGYKFPLWAINGHLQTLYSLAWREIDAPKPSDIYRRESFTSSEGGVLYLDWHKFPPSCPQLTIVIVPGIGSSSEAGSIRHLVQRISEQNKIQCKVIVFNHRGCTGDITTPKLFTYAGTEDFHEALLHIKQTNGDIPMVAIGFSMGGNMVAKYLGECGNHSDNSKANLLTAAMVISQGYNGEIGIKHIRQSIYNKAITYSLKSTFKRHSHHFKKHFNVTEILEKVQNVEQYDEHVTCKIFGYPDAVTYYKEHSSEFFLKNIKIPLFLLNSLDDPLVPQHLIPYQTIIENENIILSTTKHGGHIGWIEGSWFPRRWLWHEKLILEFVECVNELMVSVT